MQHCQYCGSELPEQAHFCGYCGRFHTTTEEEAASFTRPSDANLQAFHAPTIISSASHPPLSNEEQNVQNETMRTSTPENLAQFAKDRQTDEPRAISPEALLPGLLAGNTPASAGHVPLVQGTPQIGGVPMVHGTPQMGVSMGQAQGTPQMGVSMGQAQGPGTPHLAQGLYHQAAPSVPGAPSPTAPASPYSPGTGTPPMYQPAQPQPVVGTPPYHSPYPLPSQPGAPTQPNQQLPLQQHAPRPHGWAMRWLLVGVVSIVVILSFISAALILFPPALSLSGSNTVFPGDVLQVHGSAFTPGSSVTLTLDKGLPLAYMGRNTNGEALYGGGVKVATALQLLNVGQLKRVPPPNKTILVSSAGTFDVMITVNELWSLGTHTIHATDSFISRSTALTFTIVTKPASLVASPSVLDFGTLGVGSKAILSVMVSNAGGQQLNWVADTNGAKWFKVDTFAGTVQPASLPQSIYVTADTSHLAVGIYNGTLRISSERSQARVGVKLSVVPQGNKRQALIHVSSNTLDFGTRNAGQQVVMQMSVGNAGEQNLTWQASNGNANWLTLSNNKGMIRAGSRPQTIFVTANTTQLPAGNFSATIQISSNGGNAQVVSTIAVIVRQQPLPPPPPTNVPHRPAIVNVSPHHFNANNDCSYLQGDGWICRAVVSNDASAQSNLNWTASAQGNGIHDVAFYPSNVTLSPGQSVPLYILIPDTKCPSNATFSYVGPANTAYEGWDCTPQPVKLTVSPFSFNAQTDCTRGDAGSWACVATLSGDNTQSNLDWSVSTGLPGVAFSLASGTLPPGQGQQVNIVVPANDCQDGTFNFAGPNNTVKVGWSCAPPPRLTINPASFTTDSNCTSSSDGWTCTTTLTPASGAQGNLDWSSSTDLPGVTFTPANGTLAPGQSMQVSIFVPSSACKAGTFSFTGPANTATGSWSCTPTPQTTTITISPDSFTANGNCPSSDGGWTCTATLSLPTGSQNNLDWSSSSDLTGVTFTPANGTLTPGQNTQVSIFVPSSACKAGTFSFTGPANPATRSWTCTAITVNPDSFTANENCPSTDGGWTCTATLSPPTGSQNNLDWSSSSDLPGVTFTPANGTLTAGQSTQVSIFVPSSACKAGTFSFKGGTSPTAAKWNCTALTVTPTSLDTSNCTLMNNTWECTVAVAESSDAPGNVNWSVSSDVSTAQFNPQSGQLSPGQSVNVVMTVDCTSGKFTFTGGSQPVVVPWTCSATATPTATDTATPTDTSTPTPTDTPTDTPTPVPTDTPTPSS